MVIRVINKFHNVDFDVIPNGNFTLTKYKRYVKRACNQKDCHCKTDVYIRVNNLQEADFYTEHTESKYWRLVDPVDLELKEKGYGVKL